MTTKKRTHDKKLDFHSVFTMNEVRGGKLVLKPKLNEYGVKKIKIFTNKNEEIVLDEETTLWARKIEGTTNSGKEYCFYDVSIATEV